MRYRCKIAVHTVIRSVLKHTKIILGASFLMALIYGQGIASATINPNNYTIDMSIQNQNQGIEVSDIGATDLYVSTMRTFTVNTNSPSGYRIYVSVPSNESSGGNLLLVGGDSSSPSISKINTTPATASTLGINNWGFGIPNTTTGLPTNNYSQSYISGTPAASSTYSGIEINPGYTLVRNVQSAVSGNDSFDVYYGMRVGSDVLSHPGTYQTNISYHTAIEATDVVGGEATITPSSGPKSGYETLTITTSLMTDFVPSDIGVTIDGVACDNPKGNISTGTLIVTCVSRAHTPGLTDVVVNINSLGISYTIEDGYEYLETGDVKITGVSYISGTNVSGTPNPSVDSDNNVDFDLTFKSGITQNDQTFTARYRLTMTNTTSSDYIFTAPVSNLVLRLSSTTTSEVYYELDGIAVGDTIPANSTKSFEIILSADYVSGTHGVEGGIEVEPVEDKSGSLIGTISGTNEGDLTGSNDLAMFQLSVQNTFSSAKVFTIEILGNDFTVANSSGNYLETQTIAANTTDTYTFYVKKASGATYGSDYVNAAVVINYDGVQSSSGTLKLAVDKDPSFIDSEAPYISDVTITRNDTIGSATVTWTGTDNVGVASYAIYPCRNENDAYVCGDPITGISGDATSYTLTGLSDGTYGVVVVGYDDEGNTATQTEINDATTDAGHASRSADTEIKWTFTITGKISNGSLSNNGSTIQMGATYTGTITPNSNYSTPGSITVVMNNRTLSSSEYTYRNGSITITIPADGDIEITASCPFDWCLVEGTMIALADGTSIPIEQVTYDTLLKVWNYETGSVGAEYPAWIEKRAIAVFYQLVKFSDGSELKIAGSHGVFDVDKNEFVATDGQDFNVGSRVYKVNDNNELEIVTVTSIEIVEEDVAYYHVASSQYYNVIANNILTTNSPVYLSNLYGFDENVKWPAIREQFLSNPENLYTYEDFEDIGMPRKMFDDLRVREGKQLEIRYGITLADLKNYFLSTQLNPDVWLHYCDGSERLKEEFCPAEPEESEVVQQNDSAAVASSVPSDEEDNSSLQETEPNLNYIEPLGSKQSVQSTESITTDNNLPTSILVGATSATAILGLLYFMVKDKKDE